MKEMRPLGPILRDGFHEDLLAESLRSSLRVAAPFTEAEWVKIIAKCTLESVPLCNLKQSFIDGLPPSLRGHIWLFVTKHDSFSSSFGRNSFELAIRKADPKSAAMILKDLSRTFPSLLSSDELRCKFRRILCAYAGTDPEVGYCQGMGFIAAAILLVVQDEFQAFSIFYHIMRDKNWRELYTEGIPGCMKLLSRTYEEVKESMSALHTHIKDLPLNGCFSQYFMTAFLSCLSFEDSLKVLDRFIIEGGDFLVSLLIKMLQLNQYELLQMDEEALYEFIRNSLARRSFEKYGSLTLLSAESCDTDEFEDYVLF